MKKYAEDSTRHYSPKEDMQIANRHMEKKDKHYKPLRKIRSEPPCDVISYPLSDYMASLVAQAVKNLLQCGKLGSIPGLGRYSGGGHGNPLQYSCLENPMDRGAWGATVHGVLRSWTRLND